MTVIEKQNKSIIPFPLIIISVCTFVLGFLDILLHLLSADVSTNADEPYMDVITYVVSAMCVLNDDIADNSNSKEDSKRPTKCQHYNYAHSCVQAAVCNDKLDDKLDDKQFQWISKAIYEMISQLFWIIPFFQKIIQLLWETIDPDVKLLMTLKVNMCGVAANLFCNNFQMLWVNHAQLLWVLQWSTHSMQGIYFYLFNVKGWCAESVKVAFLKHGICGILGCLNCMHIVWKNCPVALQGAFTGKNEMSTLVIRAMSDFNLWIWQASFGFTEALHDLNFWEYSLLLLDMLNGMMASLDFDFWIGGCLFKILFVLVDGIYPETARSIKTISVPTGNAQKWFSAWQEAMHKNVECTLVFYSTNSRYSVIHSRNGIRSISMKPSCCVSCDTIGWYKNA